jgi:hypothetical protein
MVKNVVVRCAEWGQTMTNDRHAIFQNRRTLQERNQMRKTMVAHVLKSEYGQEFKTCRILVGDRFFNVDLMSEDDEIIVKIISPNRSTHEKISSGKFQHILSAILVLRSIDSKRKLLIFTNESMHQKFVSSIASMPGPICDTINGIEIAWIPLSDEFDNCEYSELTPNFRINPDGFRHTRRGQE